MVWKEIARTMLRYARLACLSPSRRRRAIIRLTKKALRDERGGEVLEFALVAGLILVGSIATIACAGTKVLNRWTSINASIK